MAERSIDQFAPEAFARIEQTQEIHGISRPSLSYWQDAWIRLKANRRALYSLYLIVGLLLFTFLGPVLWNVDPAAQDVEQISQPPLADRTITIVPAQAPDRTVDAVMSLNGFTAAYDRLLELGAN